MKIGIFKLVITNIVHRKLRAWLTILGIIIGIAAIVSLYSLGQGLQNAVEAQFSQMGADRVLIVPKGLRGPPLGAEGLTKKDVETVSRVPDLERVAGMLWLPANIEFNKKELYGTIQAVPKETFDEDMKQMGREVAQGNSIQTAGKFAVVVGSKYTEKDDKRFDKEMRVNNKIKINGYDFKVSGILKKTGVSEVDTMFWISLDDGREIFNKPEEVSAIAGYLRKGSTLEKAKERTIKELKRARDDEDFEVITPEELKAQVNTILGVVQAVLIGIASISILVGAIGILNAMFTSVLERTKDIGIMKSIGAKNSDILIIFLIESGAIGLLGGLVGALLGLGMAYFVGFIAATAGFELLKVQFNLNVFIFSLAFAFFVGVISGIVPAYRASKLKPVDALRYE